MKKILFHRWRSAVRRCMFSRFIPTPNRNTNTFYIRWAAPKRCLFLRRLLRKTVSCNSLCPMGHEKQPTCRYLLKRELVLPRTGDPEAPSGITKPARRRAGGRGGAIYFRNTVSVIFSDHSFSFFFLSSRQAPRPSTETTPVTMKKSMLLVSPVAGEGVGFCSGALNTSLMRPSPSTLS